MADWTFTENLCEFSPDNIKLTNNQLLLSITKKNNDAWKYPAKEYLASELYTPDEFLYGKYKMKIKPNCPTGVVASFFLIHIDFDENYKALDWAEIDMEFPGSTNKIQFNVRWMEEGKSGIQDKPVVIDLDFDASKEFHEYTIEWAPTYIVFYIDDKLYHKVTDPKILKELAVPQSLRMNYWIADIPSWVGPFDSKVLPIESKYKELKVYSYNN